MNLQSRLTIFLMLSLSSISSGSVLINVNADALNGVGGTGDPASANALVALVADTDNGGVSVWQGAISVGGYLDNAPSSPFNTDLIVGLRTLGTGSLNTPGSFLDAFAGLTLSGAWNSGDNLYLVWFPNYTISTTSSVAGDNYGIISLGATPADGFDETFYYITPDSSFFFNPPGGSDPITIANLQVQPVPEPSSFFVLAGLGLMGLLRRRVRRPAN